MTATVRHNRAIARGALLAASIALAAFSWCCAPAQAAEVRPERLLVRLPAGFLQGSPLSVLDPVLEAVGGGIGTTGWVSVTILDGTDPVAKAAQLVASGIEAEPDFVVTRDDTIPNDAAYFRISAAMQRIDAPKAWDIHTGSGASGPTVCVIDSGINVNHQDLRANIGPAIGYNAITDSQGDAVNDDDSHGSHCAGTVAGVGNNGEGVAGVGWSTRILGCKFLSMSGSGFTSDAVECVRWCRQQGAQVTSNSWGGGGFSRALYNEIEVSQRAGHLFIAAAGNSGCDLDGGCNSYPASFDLPGIVSVGASDNDDREASFSNFGETSVDLFAPGVGIYSTVLDSGYGFKSGTSMACPHVAGAAALVWSYRPELTGLEVKAILMDTVDSVQRLDGLCATGGRLNVNNAILAAGGGPQAPSPVPEPSPQPSPQPVPTPGGFLGGLLPILGRRLLRA